MHLIADVIREPPDAFRRDWHCPEGQGTGRHGALFPESHHSLLCLKSEISGRYYVFFFLNRRVTHMFQLLTQVYGNSTSNFKVNLHVLPPLSLHPKG